MSAFLLTAMPFSGHVGPITAIAAALVARGHRVRVYTGTAFRGRVEATGAGFLGWKAARDFDENNLAATFPRVTERPGLRQLLINMVDVFIASAPGQVADLQAEYTRDPWDVLVSEESSIGPRLFTEKTGCRWVTVAVLPLQLVGPGGAPSGMGISPGRNVFGRGRDKALRALVPLLAGPLRGPANQARAAVGLSKTSATYDTQVFSPALILASGIPALDYSRTDRPAHLHWVGELRAPARTDSPPPAWWGDLEGRRVVHVTQGTQNVDPDDLIGPTLEALADLDAIVVATTGLRGREVLPFAVPDNARVTDFVPYDLLLPRTDIVVTNGGWGGVIATLAHGIPLVAAGAHLDKPEVAARVAFSGAGVNLRTGRPAPTDIRAALDRVTTDASYRTAATRIAADLDAAGGATRAADLLTDFLAG